jgi:hypothetical protein
MFHWTNFREDIQPTHDTIAEYLPSLCQSFTPGGYFSVDGCSQMTHNRTVAKIQLVKGTTMTHANMNAQEKQEEIRRLKKAFWLFATTIQDGQIDTSDRAATEPQQGPQGDAAGCPLDCVQSGAKRDRK